MKIGRRGEWSPHFPSNWFYFIFCLDVDLHLLAQPSGVLHLVLFADNEPPPRDSSNHNTEYRGPQPYHCCASVTGWRVFSCWSNELAHICQDRQLLKPLHYRCDGLKRTLNWLSPSLTRRTSCFLATERETKSCIEVEETKEWAQSEMGGRNSGQWTHEQKEIQM